ncbi:hypothetical protein BgAZ_204350 [Babesia gibsoni]|uniref:Uncharacterized protein n=1 Tax=Babesia gibsoni TaxID=33632 RepID=A0AAD8LMG7_BABGI|nr:hypothetical protein BgAZ_204350 [Babesia gibsoni]
MLLTGVLRQCLPYISHNIQNIVFQANKALLNSIPSHVHEGSERKFLPSNLLPTTPETFSISPLTFILAQPTNTREPILVRRHRGGKVKNKLRNIEKRKKREQGVMSISADVKFPK